MRLVGKVDPHEADIRRMQRRSQCQTCGMIRGGYSQIVFESQTGVTGCHSSWIADSIKQQPTASLPTSHSLAQVVDLIQDQLATVFPNSVIS